MNNTYTFGIKHVSGDTVMCYNMSESEARSIALADPQFKFAYVDTRKYKPETLAEHDALKGEEKS